MLIEPALLSTSPRVNIWLISVDMFRNLRHRCWLASYQLLLLQAAASDGLDIVLAGLFEILQIMLIPGGFAHQFRQYLINGISESREVTAKG